MISGYRRLIAVVAVLWAWAAMPAVLSADDTPPTSNWPMHVTASDGTDVTIFQPQLESFEGDTLSGRAAVAVIPQNQQEPVYGAVWLQSRVETDRVARTVHIVDVNVTKVLFPSPATVATQPLSDAVKQAILSHPIVISLDHLLASVEALQKEQTAAADLQTTPPAIVFRDHPAVKVQYDGTPKMVQASDSGVMRAVNTPFFVALDPSSRTYYLRGAGHWFAAPDPMGPFKNVAQAPDGISQLAAQIGYADPQQAVTDDVAAGLEIVTATDPTELIWTDGQPQMSTIPGTGLLYWANTDSDVFLQIATQQTYVLLSGRWFMSHGTGGPWTYVAANQLPGDFAKIPADSPKANVLAQIAGTQAAEDAVADTYIPQTAAVDINNYQQPQVTYDGDPDFEPIQGVNFSYAANSESSVILDNGVYYCCNDGVWFQGTQAVGPWGLCRHVPREIYDIPPSCPIYPVRFCYVYGATDQFVYCGYTPGYVGCFPFGGTVVFGTGYRYNPFFHDRYFARPLTFGFGARYHAYSGHWGFGFGIAAGGGDAWIGGGEHAQPRAWFGYGGYRPSMVRATTNINRNIVNANNANVRAGHDVYKRNVYERRKDVRETAVREVPAGRETPAGPGAHQGELKANDVYANPQGEVYRRSDSGWEKREGDQWKAAAPAHEEPVQRAEPQHEEPIQHSAPLPPSAPPREERPANNGGGHEEHVTSNGDGGAPERDYHARQQGEERERQNAPAPQHVEPAHVEPSHATQGHK
ncbi:MAG TPA: hypothetical protein VGG44_07520 [Tepidisphaeraceae bacterium]|jgi:hypothetical protein